MVVFGGGLGGFGWFWRMEFSPQPITFMTMQPNKIEIARTIKMMHWTARERCRCGNLQDFLTNSTTEHALQRIWPEIKTQ